MWTVSNYPRDLNSLVEVSKWCVFLICSQYKAQLRLSDHKLKTALLIGRCIVNGATNSRETLLIHCCQGEKSHSWAICLLKPWQNYQWESCRYPSSVWHTYYCFVTWAIMKGRLQAFRSQKRIFGEALARLRLEIWFERLVFHTSFCQKWS